MVANNHPNLSQCAIFLAFTVAAAQTCAAAVVAAAAVGRRNRAVIADAAAACRSRLVGCRSIDSPQRRRPTANSRNMNSFSLDVSTRIKVYPSR